MHIQWNTTQSLKTYIWNNATCNNMDGCYRWERKRQISCDIIYMWNLKYDTYGLTYRTETHTQTQRTDWRLARGWRGGTEQESGAQQRQTVPYRMEWQGSTTQHRELYSISCDKPQWPRTLRKIGTSLVVQQLRLHASTAGAWVRSPVRELRFCMPHSSQEKKCI